MSNEGNVDWYSPPNRGTKIPAIIEGTITNPIADPRSCGGNTFRSLMITDRNHDQQDYLLTSAMIPVEMTGGPLAPAPYDDAVLRYGETISFYRNHSHMGRMYMCVYVYIQATGQFKSISHRVQHEATSIPEVRGMQLASRESTILHMPNKRR